MRPRSSQLCLSLQVGWAFPVHPVPAVPRMGKLGGLHDDVDLDENLIFSLASVKKNETRQLSEIRCSICR